MARIVPIVVSAPPPEFGTQEASSELMDPHGADGDRSYVPGFSDQRRRRDQEVAEVLHGTRRPQDVITLTHNLRWGRDQTKAGDPDSLKVLNHARRGYRLVTKADIGSEWLRELPPGATLGTDGTIRQYDTVLLVTDASHAARNQAEKARRTAGQVQDTTELYKASVPGGAVETEVAKSGFRQGKKA